MKHIYTLGAGMARFIDSDFFQIGMAGVIFVSIFTFSFCYALPSVCLQLFK